MSTPLRVLIVEDSENDAELIMHELRHADYSLAAIRVESREAMDQALKNHKWDLVLCDHAMPAFSSDKALELFNEYELDIPFIIVSGTIGEEHAVAAMRAGCNDYVMKNNIKRLVPAIQRELRDAEERRAHKQAQEAIRANEEAERRFQEKLTVLLALSNELATIDSFDDLCKQAVQLGKSRLGFDRLGIWFIHNEDKPDYLYGSFGTDIHGKTLDKREEKIDVSDDARELLERKKPYSLWTESASGDNQDNSLQPITHVCAAIWNGEKNIGLINADNLITRQPISHRDCELLALYASSLGHLCSRRLADEERRNLEAQIQHAQRLESLGVLAGGIAHDFNNLLTIINGNAQYIRQSLTLEATIDNALKDIEIAARHAADMTRSLQTFSRPTKPQIRNADANTLVEEAHRLLRRAIPATIQIKLDRDQSPCPIDVDTGQIQQMLVNLCVNARDAMPTGGTLTIRTRHVKRDALPSHADKDQLHDKYICISVTDTGCGMDKQTLSKVFDPFFTTKPKDRGTGLGLSVVYKIVQAHKGVIDVKSRVGQGTTFYIYIPEAPSYAETIETPAMPSARGEEHILVVDDEEMIASLLKTLLESRGYHVAVTNKPEDAIKIVDAANHPFDLAIVDQTMPHMTGEQCLAAIRRKNPHLKAILITGYGIDQSSITEPNTFLVHKPFSGQEITDYVRDILDKGIE